MEITLTRRFQFEAAHRLPRVPPEHKCARLHGHSFQIELELLGPVDPELGWLMDFADIKTAWGPLHEALDHRYLNEIEGLSNPTSEVLAAWIWERLEPRLPWLRAVSVAETCTSRATYQGPAR
jgi:6-pyruvoyltetrahydropterin/6-carboxytetrahydropterin synthase